MTGFASAVGVAVMRVQVPALHEGHRQLIDHIRKYHEDVLIVLGSPRGFPTHINPLSYEIRKAMVLAAYPDVSIDEIKDHPISPTYWSQELDALIASRFPQHTPVLYGSRNSFLERYHGIHQVRYVPPQSNISGTELRNTLKIPESEDARTALIYREVHRAPMVYPTVDLGIKRVDAGLFIRKNIHQGFVSFVGGFIDPNESAEQAVVREQHEEIPTVKTTLPEFLFSTPIDDPRYRGGRDSILTSFFQARYLGGEPTPGDDADDVLWVPRQEIIARVVPWHQPLAVEFVRNW